MDQNIGWMDPNDGLPMTGDPGFSGVCCEQAPVDLRGWKVTEFVGTLAKRNPMQEIPQVAPASEKIVKRKDRKGLSRPAQWRIFSLTVMSLVIAAHIAHWKINGRSLSSLQLSEAGRLAAEGVANTALFYFAALLLSTAIFGRLFCGWGCKMLAAQEICRWILGRLGIRPKLIRLRTLWLAPTLLCFYIFFFPAVQRLWLGEPMPSLRVELMSDDLTADVSGSRVGIATILVCCIGMVYVMGSLSFCRYGCPYSPLFSLADRLAPGRIRLHGSCDGCAQCTAACSSSIRVHEEILQYGVVVNSDCNRCLECVSSCPSDAISYGWGWPTLFKKAAPITKPSEYPFTLGEEILLLGVLTLSFMALNNLYGALPLLLSLSISTLVAYLTVLSLRLVQVSEVRLRHRILKRAGQVSPTGVFVFVMTVLVWGLISHSLLMQFHRVRATHALTKLGYPGVQTLTSDEDLSLAQRATDDLRFFRNWSLINTLDANMQLAWLARARGDVVELERELRNAIAVDPGEARAHFNLGKALMRQGREEEAAQSFAEAVRLAPQLASYVPGGVRVVNSVVATDSTSSRRPDAADR